MERFEKLEIQVGSNKTDRFSPTVFINKRQSDGNKLGLVTANIFSFDFAFHNSYYAVFGGKGGGD